VLESVGLHEQSWEKLSEMVSVKQTELVEQWQKKLWDESHIESQCEENPMDEGTEKGTEICKRIKVTF